MPNTFFRFKKFTIQQDKCAMKVCTDSCIFGAWIASHFGHKSIQNILDIGTGTGLLALILAQKINAEIDAVDINPDAFKQAQENINQSPWKDKCKVFNQDILSFDAGKIYDLIVCNPPFYQNYLRSPKDHINQARHDSTLQPDDLVQYAKRLLTSCGSLAVLLPYQFTGSFAHMAAEQGLYLNNLLIISNSPDASPIRSILIFSNTQTEVVTSNLAIREGKDYSTTFESLLQDYYLAL